MAHSRRRVDFSISGVCLGPVSCVSEDQNYDRDRRGDGPEYAILNATEMGLTTGCDATYFARQLKWQKNEKYVDAKI